MSIILSGVPDCHSCVINNASSLDLATHFVFSFDEGFTHKFNSTNLTQLPRMGIINVSSFTMIICMYTNLKNDC